MWFEPIDFKASFGLFVTSITSFTQPSIFYECHSFPSNSSHKFYKNTLYLFLARLMILKLENAKFYTGFGLGKVFFFVNSCIHSHTFFASFLSWRDLRVLLFFHLKIYLCQFSKKAFLGLKLLFIVKYWKKSTLDLSEMNEYMEI